MNKPFSLLSKTPGKEMEDYKLVFDTNLQFLLPLESSLLFFSLTVLVSSSSAESSCLPGLLREELIQFCLALKMLTLCRSELEGPAFFPVSVVVGERAVKTSFNIPTSQLKLKLKKYLFDLRLTEMCWCWEKDL